MTKKNEVALLESTVKTETKDTVVPKKQAKTNKPIDCDDSSGLDCNRVFVLDTNVLLHDSKSIISFVGAVVVIPMVVLEELDKFKSEKTELGRNAREVSRYLDGLRKQGSLQEGVVVENSGHKVMVKVMPSSIINLSGEDFDLHADLFDNTIILMAKYFGDAGYKTTLISKDINVRLKADALGIDVDGYLKGAVKSDEYYKGWVQVDLDGDDLKKINGDNIGSYVTIDILQMNQFVVFTSGGVQSRYRLFRYLGKKRFKDISNQQNLWIFSDKNVHQRMALDLLLDDSIQMVSLLGQAGTGKTFLTLLAGLHKTIEEKSYSKMLVARPIVSLGADIGFLPGDIQEKLYEWMHPVYDNLDFIFNELTAAKMLPAILKREKREEKRGRFDWKKRKREDDHHESYGPQVHAGVAQLKSAGLLTLEAITYMRGRSIPKQFMFIDEVQNLTPHEVKTIISRAGEGTKVILCGDPYQIDSPYLDFTSNGLTVTGEKMKGMPITGIVMLENSERSYLAKIAAELL